MVDEVVKRPRILLGGIRLSQFLVDRGEHLERQEPLEQRCRAIRTDRECPIIDRLNQIRGIDVDERQQQRDVTPRRVDRPLERVHEVVGSDRLPITERRPVLDRKRRRAAVIRPLNRLDQRARNRVPGPFHDPVVDHKGLIQRRPTQRTRRRIRPRATEQMQLQNVGIRLIRHPQRRRTVG